MGHSATGPVPRSMGRDRNSNKGKAPKWLLLFRAIVRRHLRNKAIVAEIQTAVVPPILTKLTSLIGKIRA
jgi:hypothetical protein